jgi:hypothetical protein
MRSRLVGEFDAFRVGLDLGSCTVATVLIPSSRQARWTRRAISPRLAIRIFSNVGSPLFEFRSKGLTALRTGWPLHGRQGWLHSPGEVATSISIERFHRLDDARRRTLFDSASHLNERFHAGLTGPMASVPTMGDLTRRPTTGSMASGFRQCIVPIGHHRCRVAGKQPNDCRIGSNAARAAVDLLDHLGPCPSPSAVTSLETPDLLRYGRSRKRF